MMDKITILFLFGFQEDPLKPSYPYPIFHDSFHCRFGRLQGEGRPAKCGFTVGLKKPPAGVAPTTAIPSATSAPSEEAGYRYEAVLFQPDGKAGASALVSLANQPPE
jgi:hypothetical protein